MSEIKWLDDVEEKDFDAALSYLTLKLDEKRAKAAVRRLRKSKIRYFRANDILRAAGLQPAPLDDPQVIKNRGKTAAGVPLSPVLLMNLRHGCDVADGYHRVSSVYYEDPDARVPARLE